MSESKNLTKEFNYIQLFFHLNAKAIKGRFFKFRMRETYICG